MRYIPCYLNAPPRPCLPVSMEESYTLQADINPEEVVKRFKQFKFDKILSEFGFCDEDGTEYFVQCVKSGAHLDQWVTVVTISSSLNPREDVSKFFYWLSSNFGDS